MKILNALGYGGIMMVIGMLVVFFGLAILILLISLMSAIFKKIDKSKEEKAAAAAAAAAPAPVPEIEEATEAAEADVVTDPQLIAVIAAAIAAFDQSGKNLVVRKVRRASGWKGSARQEQIYHF